MIQHLDLVRIVTCKFKRRLPACVSYDDLYQAGCIGLMQAAEGFDDSKGKFGPYASQRIHGAMLDHLRDMNWVPRLIEARGGDIARMVPFPLDTTRNGDRNHQPGDTQDWDSSDLHTPEPGWALEQREEVEHMVRGLPREHQLIMLMYFIEGLTMQEVGEALGLSESMISVHINKWLNGLAKVNNADHKNR